MGRCEEEDAVFQWIASGVVWTDSCVKQLDVWQGRRGLVCYMQKCGRAEDSEEPVKCLKQKNDMSQFFKVHNGSRAAARTDFRLPPSAHVQSSSFYQVIL